MSNNNKTVVNSGGPGFLGWLTLIFITLKLTGFISWSWMWVLAPLWFGLGIWLIIIIALIVLKLLS